MWLKNPLKTVARVNIPLSPYFPPIKISKKTKSELKIKEYMCQVPSKSLENCGL